jgi:thioredoxin 1
MAVINSNQDTFQTDVLDVPDTPVLVDFWAPWCGPCQMMGPVIDDLDSKLGGKAKFVKVNVDDNGELAGQYGIMSIPALKVFKNGQLVDEMVGVHDKNQLMEVINKHL